MPLLQSDAPRGGSARLGLPTKEDRQQLKRSSAERHSRRISGALCRGCKRQDGRFVLVGCGALCEHVSFAMFPGVFLRALLATYWHRSCSKFSESEVLSCESI